MSLEQVSEPSVIKKRPLVIVSISPVEIFVQVEVEKSLHVGEEDGIGEGAAEGVGLG